MTNSVPAPFTLAIAVGDTINYRGNHYTISAVSSADNGQGFVNYTLTISVGTLVVNYTNCVLSSDGAFGPATWVQSANA